MRRRDLFKMFGVLASFPLLGKLANASSKDIKFENIKKETPVAVLYHCDFGQIDRFTTMMRNIGNHLSVYNYDPFKIKIVVIAHGPGVKYFMKDLSGSPWENERAELDKAHEVVKNLLQYGALDIYICKITLQRLKLKEESFYDYVKFVPSGVGAIGEMQAKGYAYIKVG